MNKTFHLGDVLSITTGRLVSPDGIDGVYRICDYMLDTSHFTHQLPRASKECRPHLLVQHPQLAEVEPPDEFEDEAHVWRWLAEQTERYGVELPVQRVYEPVHRDPIAELVEMRGGTDGIIGVVVDP
jgi:hypothetical protein